MDKDGAVDAAMAYLTQKLGPAVHLTKVKKVSPVDTGLELDLLLCDDDACFQEHVLVNRAPDGSWQVQAGADAAHDHHEQPMLALPDKAIKWLVYSVDECPYCERAKALLTGRGQKYVEINCDETPGGRKKAADTLASFTNNHRTFPMIFEDGVFIGGCSDLTSYLQKADQAFSMTTDF